ncbi:MAG: glycogen-binding domain-containing protein, partial [Candidatus Krumholzibacteriia bacterium]
MWRARVAFYAWLGILAGHGTAASRPESGDGVVRFVYVDPAASEVYLVGDFNGWSPSATPLDPEQDGAWVALVFMDPGTYEYKFLVDGSWRLDPDNPEVSPNGNSMVRVGAGGAVLSSGVTGDGVARTGPGSAGTGSESLRWFVRYLGLFTSRRDRETQRYDLDRPTHDVDLRLEVEFGHDVTGWFLTNFNNLEEGTELSRTSLRYDRGMVLWRPGASAVRFFDNVGVTDFADPGALVGRVGIYADAFGFGRRGVVVRRRILGAPLELVYADDTEPGTGGAPETALPALHAAGAGALAGRTVQRYVASTSDRNADALALRFRAGTADEGLGFGYRLDRGAAAGRLSRVAVRSDSLGLVGAGREFETTEDWQAWNLDLRLRGFGARLIAEYMSGNRVASATRVTRLEEVRADTAAGTTQGVFGRPVTSDEDFDLDDSRRVVLRLAGADGARAWIPQLTYEYQENDFSALVTGTPFLMRRHGLELGVGGRL